jgi:hypothetical protein
MTTYAAAIAARLQGREDEDMSKDEDIERARALFDRLRDDYVNVLLSQDADVGRVAELERAREADLAAVTELQRKLMDAERELAAVKETLWQVTAHRNAAANRGEELEQLLAVAYVAREVPWTDVAAGMMTIARDGTPWMVETWVEGDYLKLRNGTGTFSKYPKSGETVRVLVPYVTDEQAEGLVASELGGREVGS